MHQLTGLDEVVTRVLIVMMPKRFGLDVVSVCVREIRVKDGLTLFPILLQKGQLQHSRSR